VIERWIHRSFYNTVVCQEKGRMTWAGYVACMGKKRNAYRILMGKPEEKRPLRRCTHRWLNDIEMDLR
jgi:hypothetical protein